MGQEVQGKSDEHLTRATASTCPFKHCPVPGAKPAHPGSRPSGPRERSGYRGGSPHGGAPRSGSRPRSGSSGNARFAPREPQTFEDKLKQYMAESESKLSQLSRYNDRGKGRRRRGS